MRKTHDAELCERIRDLEERVRELEARPATVTYPWWGVVPNTTSPWPYTAYPWTITYGTTTGGYPTTDNTTYYGGNESSARPLLAFNV